MSQPQRLRPEAPDRGPLHEASGVSAARADRGGQDRASPRRDREQPVGSQETVPRPGIAREPAVERRADPPKVGWPPRDRDDGQPRHAMETVQVEHVESAEHDPVDQERSPVLGMAQTLQQVEDPVRCVDAVDLDRAEGDGLHVEGRCHRDRSHGGSAVGAGEPAVVDPDDPKMALRQRAL